MNQLYRYTIFFQTHSGVGVTEFDGTGYFYDHSEGTWHFANGEGRELVAQGSDVSYFQVEPISQTTGSASA